MRTELANLLTYKCDAIVHQCNCITLKCLGLAQAIEEKFPHGRLYQKRTPITLNANLATEETRDVPGTFQWMKSESPDQPDVVALLAQWRPGKVPSSYSYPECEPIETPEQRLQWFKTALDRLGVAIVQMNNQRKIKLAFPYMIGCGLAGGDWNLYSKALDEFEEKYKHVLEAVICRL